MHFEWNVLILVQKWLPVYTQVQKAHVCILHNVLNKSPVSISTQECNKEKSTQVRFMVYFVVGPVYLPHYWVASVCPQAKEYK